MTTFTIDAENQIVAFATAEEAAAATVTPFDSFTSQQELAEVAAPWPAERLMAIWNTLPGVTPVNKCKNAKALMARIWTHIQNLAETTTPRAATLAPEVRRARRDAAGKLRKASRTRKVKGRQAGSPGHAPRAGSKAAQVISLLRRKQGATLAEIMHKMGWQKHYADVQIMPTCVGNPACGAVIAAMKSA